MVMYCLFPVDEDLRAAGAELVGMARAKNEPLGAPLARNWLPRLHGRGLRAASWTLLTADRSTLAEGPISFAPARAPTELTDEEPCG